jgi:hypothetical protein
MMAVGVDFFPGSKSMDRKKWMDVKLGSFIII